MADSTAPLQLIYRKRHGHLKLRHSLIFDHPPPFRSRSSPISGFYQRSYGMVPLARTRKSGTFSQRMCLCGQMLAPLVRCHLEQLPPVADGQPHPQ